MLRFYIPLDDRMHVGHKLLVIQFGKQASEMAPVIQPVYFVQAAPQFLGNLKTGINGNIQDFLIEISCGPIEYVSAAILKNRFKSLMEIRKCLAFFSGKIVIVRQLAKCDVGKEYLLQRRHLFRHIFPFGFNTLIRFAKERFDRRLRFTELRNITLIGSKLFGQSHRCIV